MADLELALTVANEKLLSRDQQLCMNSAAKTEIEAKLHATDQRLEDVTKKLKDATKENDSLSKRLATCEHEFAALSRAESDTALKLSTRERELVNVCKVKVELEDRIAVCERKVAALCAGELTLVRPLKPTGSFLWKHSACRRRKTGVPYLGGPVSGSWGAQLQPRCQSSLTGSGCS